MALASDRSLAPRRHFTSPGVHPYDEVVWDRRDVEIRNAIDGEVVFAQSDVEFPASWSVTASTIVTQKYFRGTPGTAERESSLRQLLDRVVDTIVGWGVEGGYFHDEEAEVFGLELRWLLLNQRAAFNSPVWFNIGVPGVPQQASACFILSVDDEMESILNWYVEEGVIFKGGSGAGVNLSRIRASTELLRGGGEASGPVSFMRGADASAGTIKSGGKTRRAAKMVLLDADHPDVGQFIWCKAREERKARVLRDAGFDMDLDGVDAHSIQYQNANNSVRLSDEFMEAVVADGDWDLTARTDGRVLETTSARSLFAQIAQAAWECADPGIQFSSTINRWHTAPNTGPITASNPCSEYLHLDDSACNLASLNLLAFLDDDTFDIDGFRHAVSLLITAQDILVSNAAYPTEAIERTSHDYRQLGLGYTNLGASLMALGVPYDSAAGRGWAGAVTALMTGQAYLTSTALAERLEPFAGYATNRDPMLGVLRSHRSAVDDIDSAAPSALVAAADHVWDEAVSRAERVGVRNSQATVIAPTGTISFMMDCDTTGIEPDLALVKQKKLVGGGALSIVNGTVGRALARLGYDDTESARIEEHILSTGSATGAPGLDGEHVAVFACSMGDNVIGPGGHLGMMAAAQPFVSGAISKTINLPETATVTDIEDLHLRAWRLGLKAVAVYRDNCKVAQPLSAGTAEQSAPVDEAAVARAVDDAIAEMSRRPERETLPRTRGSRTFSFRVADCHGFMTVGEYDDGRPGEIFLTVAKQGSTLAGIMDAFAISVSHGLQYGVPLEAYVGAFTGVRFEPAGITDDPDLRIASSLVDYIFRRLALEYLDEPTRRSLGVLSSAERVDQPLPGFEAVAVESSPGQEIRPEPQGGGLDAPLCHTCGVVMVRAGACHTCPSCGASSGCG